MPGDPTPPTTVLIVDDLIERASSESVSQWSRTFGPAVLVGPKSMTFDDYGGDIDEDEEENHWSFQTLAAGVIPKVGDDPLTSFRIGEVYGLKKAAKGAFATTLLVGRASSNDVSIDDNSLSKLHARIKLAADGTMTISDSGSMNGTMLNEEPVSSTPVALAAGDVLQLGSRIFMVYEIARFRRLVGRLRHP
ncbi:MAG: FHA domain-containing protein [Deltaproteobacteria bacterium]|nr:FHA domain-containing protein [Deltaproteobacteria bacterium]